MSKVRNQEFLYHVLHTLIAITARRSSDTVACAFLQAILVTLSRRYPFLKLVKIKNLTFYEENAVRIPIEMNTVKPELVGESIQSIIRILCLDLEEESGLFFIKEFKERLGESYVQEFKRFHIDLDILHLEQQHLHEQLEKRRAVIQHISEMEAKPLPTRNIQYSWDRVDTFKYRNNVCFLYDKTGKMLDKLQLNDIVEYYIRTITDYGKLVKQNDQLDITDKEIEFLKILSTQDLDKEFAKYLLNVKEADFAHMIQRLLRNEFLQYISDTELKLTEKGLAVLEAHTPTLPASTQA